MEIFKRKDFARWQAAHRLTDETLCQAVEEMRKAWSMQGWVANCSKSVWQRKGRASVAAIEPCYRPELAIDVFFCMASPKATMQTSRWKSRKR